MNGNNIFFFTSTKKTCSVFHVSQNKNDELCVQRSIINFYAHIGERVRKNHIIFNDFTLTGCLSNATIWQHICQALIHSIDELKACSVSLCSHSLHFVGLNFDIATTHIARTATLALATQMLEQQFIANRIELFSVNVTCIQYAA